MISIGSICSGVGGLDIGVRMWLEDAAEISWHAEVNADAALVLAKREPGVLNLRDITAPDFWAGAPPVNAQIGGVPCQPFSAAGRRQGVDDHRHLWPFWLEGIKRQKPLCVVFENVEGLTRGKMKPVFEQVRADLVALGYDVAWTVLGACAVGAAHHRHRVFLLAMRTASGHGSQRFVEVDTCGQHSAAYLPTPVARDASTRGEGGADYWSARALRRNKVESPPLGAVVTAYLPSPRARDGAGGPGHGVNMQGGLGLPAALNLLPSPRASDGSNGGPNQGIASGDIALSSAMIGDRFGKYAVAVQRHAEVMGTMPPEPTEIGPRGGRRLAAAFSEWLMMYPAGYVTDLLMRSPALARCGNGVVPLQAATALRLLDRALH